MAGPVALNVLKGDGVRMYVWILMMAAICNHVAMAGTLGCSEKEADFISCFGQFDTIEQSDTFWQQICSAYGKSVVECLVEATSGCEHFWRDTSLGDLTYAKNLLSFYSYNSDYNIACEVKTVQECEDVWECYFSVFGAADEFRHEGLFAFYFLYCGTIATCTQSAESLCPSTITYLRQTEAIVFGDGTVLKFEQIEDKVDVECTKIDQASMQYCINETSDGESCFVSTLVTRSETQCNFTGQTAPCLEEKCGTEISAFYINMFGFLRCGTAGKICEESIYGDIVFEATLPGTVITKECSTGQKGILRRTCSLRGMWEDVIDNCEWDLSDISTNIDELKNSENVSDEQIEKVLTDVKIVTEPAKVKKPPLVDVRNFAKDITVIMEKKAVIKERESSDFFDIISNTLDRPEEDWKSLIDKDKEGANTVLDNTDTIVRKIQNQDCSSLQSENTVKFTKPNIDVTVGKADKGIIFEATTADQADKGEIRVPEDAIKGQGSAVCYGAVHYRKTAAKISPRFSENGTIQRFDDRMVINSDVISLQLGENIANADPPIIVVIHHLKKGHTDPKCVFWDFTLSLPWLEKSYDNAAQSIHFQVMYQPVNSWAHGDASMLSKQKGTNEAGAWESKGCLVKNSTSVKTICHCTHLTNFAILMSINPLDPEHALTLSFISAVGCFISMICLLATVICHGIVWRRVRSDRAVILLHLCAALFIALGVFLAGINRTESKIACTVIAGTLHFLFLAVFFLMLLKGIEILLCVARLFAVKFPLVPLLVFAWLIPAVIVAISMVIALVLTKTEGYGTKEHCWLSIDSGLIWAFVGPAAFVILINFIVIIIIFRKMAVTTMLKGKSTKQQLTTCARSLCVLLPLMGCTWVFGILSVNRDLVAFQYLFCILNSLQGVFIFVFHCVLNQQLRDALRRRKERKKSQGSFKITLSRSKNDSTENSSNYKKGEKSRRKVKRNLSDSLTSSSSRKGHSDAVSPNDPFEDWQKAQRKKYQRDLRMKTADELDWTNL